MPPTLTCHVRGKAGRGRGLGERPPLAGYSSLPAIGVPTGTRGLMVGPRVPPYRRCAAACSIGHRPRHLSSVCPPRHRGHTTG